MAEILRIARFTLQRRTDGASSLSFSSAIRLGQHGRRIELATVVQRTDEKNKQGGEIGQHGQQIGRYAQRLQQILQDEYASE